MDRSLTVLLAWLLLSLASTRAQPLLRDTFDDDTVDPTLWTIFKPFTAAPPTTVTETNGNLVLFRRGIVEATGNFPTSIDIEGKFRFTGDNDALSIVFRSDLSVTNQFERRGVQVALQEGTARIFIIRVHSPPRRRRCRDRLPSRRTRMCVSASWTMKTWSGCTSTDFSSR